MVPAQDVVRSALAALPPDAGLAAVLAVVLAAAVAALLIACVGRTEPGRRDAERP